MAERNFNPGSTACGQWEMLLADALDGLLRPEDEAHFSAHMAACPACAALFEEANKGREWLEFLSPEPEIPAGLLDRILAQTGPGQMADFGLVPAESNVIPMPSIQPWQRPGFVGQVRRYAEPRLLMTAAMAFFSIALTLSLTGVRLDTVSLSALRPTMLRSVMERRLMMASTPMVRYYDHLRIRYEFSSRIRDLRRLTLEERQRQNEHHQRRDTVPGETLQQPSGQLPPVSLPQQSAAPVNDPPSSEKEFMETSLNLHQQPAHSGLSASDLRERSTPWTA